MRNAQARTTYLKDYQPPLFLIDRTELHFDLHEDHAVVKSRLLLRRNSGAQDLQADTLVLHGQDLDLRSLELDGRALGRDDYFTDEESLTIPGLSALLGRPAARFELCCETRLEPQNNTALEGLYKSKKMFCTQCEAEGFRCITYYLDRPDVMSKYTTTIVADRGKYPVLLSNGNRIAAGEVESDPTRHWVTWEDPFKKPCYLFALVAGDLASLDDIFTTVSGRKVTLRIFVEEKNLDKCDHAMASLKRAMRWDEERFGREYDLDIFMIVAVDDFNMGAMENKGLNLFNTSCVLANPKTTTDQAFRRVEAVVAHEYFHNWSGNRVTCRDWFQLSLKEGFTVYRDSEFSADMGSRTVKRVEEVNFLKTVQFAEDAGPMAHPVRPDSYMEIANFYTVTIYEKGAEIVRMIRLLLGWETFRAGCDLYFQRHDGQAVTTEEFVKAMEDASGKDLAWFRRWYTQAGTPVLDIRGDYDAKGKTYTLSVSQQCPGTPGQINKKPFVIPLRLGLLNRDGRELPLRLEGEGGAAGTERVLEVDAGKQRFVFIHIEQEPVPSLLRGFSAPVKLNFRYSREELYFLMVHDSDGFNRWNAGQLLACDIMDDMLAAWHEDQPLTVPGILRDACAGVLASLEEEPDQDRAMIAHLLSLPAESFLIERANVADVEGIHAVREAVANQLGTELEAMFAACYENNICHGQFKTNAAAMARRTLKNQALYYLVRNGAEWLQRCHAQFAGAGNMTDQLTALHYLVHSATEAAEPLKEEALAAFYRQWQHEALVVDQWFMVQATAPLPDTLERVQALLGHKDFTLRNPNKVRSLVGAFCAQNHIGFHRRDGSGYEFLAGQVLALDKLNPQIAARLLTPLTRWRRFDIARQRLMQAQLQRIKAEPKLSKDTFEVVAKSTM